jgi:serine/threonine protein kinase
MHKIFKLCGSPSEGYWQRKKLPYATSFKPQNAYKRQLADTFKDFPSTALALVDRLLAMEPEQRGSATSALHSEVILSQHPFFHYIGLFQIDSDLFVIIVINIILTLLMSMLDICQFFTTDPLPCDPSRLPKFPPSKEFDLKRQNKEAARYFKFLDIEYTD